MCGCVFVSLLMIQQMYEFWRRLTRSDKECTAITQKGVDTASTKLTRTDRGRERQVIISQYWTVGPPRFLIVVPRTHVSLLPVGRRPGVTHPTRPSSVTTDCRCGAFGCAELRPPGDMVRSLNRAEYPRGRRCKPRPVAAASSRARRSSCSSTR